MSRRSVDFRDRFGKSSNVLDAIVEAHSHAKRMAPSKVMSFVGGEPIYAKSESQGGSPIKMEKAIRLAARVQHKGKGASRV